MPDDLIFKLKRQHIELKGILSGIKTKIHSPQADGREIIARLSKFKSALARHLKLENETFYPAVLEKIKNRGLDTAETEKFIGEMKKLEKEVLDFIGTYKNPERIEKDGGVFVGEFDFIVSSLAIRISAEEDGVFLYW